MDEADAFGGDAYLVKLRNGEIVVMSPTELDESFEAGRIGEKTPVVAPGGAAWTTIAALAGLEDEDGWLNGPPSERSGTYSTRDIQKAKASSR